MRASTSSSIPRESKRCGSTDRRSVRTAGDTIEINRILFKFDHCVIVHL